MNRPQPSFTVQVDMTNPGQFFACCGLLELTNRVFLNKIVEGWFGNGTFCVSVSDSDSGIFGQVFKELLDTGIVEVTTRGDSKTHPVHLVQFNITLDWWINEEEGKTPLKLWAGQQTSSGIVKALQNAFPTASKMMDKGLFDIAAPLTGRFGVDPRTAWNALDVGFSPNTQKMAVVTYPAVELLAAVGLQRFRPMQEGQREDLRFRYTTWSIPFPPSVASAASAGLVTDSSMTTYQFKLDERGSYKGFGYSTLKEVTHEQ